MRWSIAGTDIPLTRCKVSRHGKASERLIIDVRHRQRDRSSGSSILRSPFSNLLRKMFRRWGGFFLSPSRLRKLHQTARLHFPTVNKWEKDLGVKGLRERERLREEGESMWVRTRKIYGEKKRKRVQIMAALERERISKSHVWERKRQEKWERDRERKEMKG